MPYLLLGTKDGSLDRLNEEEVEAGAAVEAAGVSKLKALKLISAGCCYLGTIRDGCIGWYWYCCCPLNF